MNLENIKGAIFDCDGLLLDTEAIYSKACQLMLDKLLPGTIFSWEMKVKMMGRKSEEAAKVLLEDLNLLNSITPKEFTRQRDEILDLLWPKCIEMPGAINIVKKFKEKGFKIAVATSCNSNSFKKKINNKSWFNLFDVILTGDDVENSKPNPEIFLKAALKLNIPIEECIIFEDSKIGIKAAIASGGLSVLVPDPRLNIENVFPTIILKSLEEFPEF